MGQAYSHEKEVLAEKTRLQELQAAQGTDFPGSDYKSPNAAARKEWMSSLDLDKVRVKDVCWPGTHDSATNKIGVPFVIRPFAQCQTLSIYDQLCLGVRAFDIRVEETRHVCHGILRTYLVDVVIEDVKKFLSETKTEFIIIEIRTEYQHADPPDFDKFLIQQFGEVLVTQDQGVFDRTLRELLPQRVILIWKPQTAAAPSPGSPLFSSGYIYDNWTDTDLPATKFNNNIEYLAKQQTNDVRKLFYRVENTATPQLTSLILCVYPVTNRIRGYARLFVSQINKQNLLDHLQIFSSDFIEADFIDVCIGVTTARLKA
ncbi:unnamed protein product [Calypogeia fissa]